MRNDESFIRVGMAAALVWAALTVAAVLAVARCVPPAWAGQESPVDEMEAEWGRLNDQVDADLAEVDRLLDRVDSNLAEMEAISARISFHNWRERMEMTP